MTLQCVLDWLLCLGLLGGHACLQRIWSEHSMQHGLNAKVLEWPWYVPVVLADWNHMHMKGGPAQYI